MNALKQWFQSLSREKAATVITFLVFIFGFLFLFAAAFAPIILLIAFIGMTFYIVWLLVYALLQIESRILKD